MRTYLLLLSSILTTAHATYKPLTNEPTQPSSSQTVAPSQTETPPEVDPQTFAPFQAEAHQQSPQTQLPAGEYEDLIRVAADRFGEILLSKYGEAFADRAGVQEKAEGQDTQSIPMEMQQDIEATARQMLDEMIENAEIEEERKASLAEIIQRESHRVSQQIMTKTQEVVEKREVEREFNRICNQTTAELNRLQAKYPQFEAKIKQETNRILDQAREELDRAKDNYPELEAKIQRETQRIADQIEEAATKIEHEAARIRNQIQEAAPKVEHEVKRGGEKLKKLLRRR